jgi:putative heme-binding domain-containing protein
MHRCCLVLAFLGQLAPAAEPWADPALKTRDGLILWLDAGRQSAARQAHARVDLAADSLLDVAYDASGQKSHLTQRIREFQPRFIRAGERAVIRFDGKDDYLGLTGQKRTLDRFTLFVHVAVRSNPGMFRALFAINETGKNDYVTGFTLDLTGEGSAALDHLNVEGNGFGGAVNLCRGSHPFRTFHTLAVNCETGDEGVKLFVDGAAMGSRARKQGTLRMDDIALGARFYSNTAEPPCMTGFLDGDIAEVLLFDRVLSEQERKRVGDYLKAKYAGLDDAIGQSIEGVPLKTVANPPPVQVLIPGFTVRELPVDLPNINNIRYRADGKLVALGYNGNVYLLSASKKDGVEDKVELFYENKGSVRAPIGMALTPPGYKHGNGVFIACKGKVVLLVDSENCGKLDKEIIVATGWKELAHGVDALGVALDKEGNVYFGLGCADYTNAYQIDKDGKSHYDIKSERGTIMKVSPDFKKREIIATGIRFPVSMAFNARGDLFATDQEGATWLPNGNPFDELLHIRKGVHYGFPPRHPKHLPDVVDEPSAFDYGPQHQSTCGLIFNESVNDGPVFGPKTWRGDALVAGYSRGKLYRTELVKSGTSYVARNQILACLNMLTVDSCVSPRGELVVAVHSGDPDWGNGPGGKGKLYKIIPVTVAPPRPVLIWPAGPGEVRVAFDQPLDPLALQGLSRNAVIEYGEHVRAGDRFEVKRPGYAAVQQQIAAPRRRLPILSAAVTPDRRTLVLTTIPQLHAAYHALTLPGWGPPVKPAANELPQHPVIDLDYDLSGVEARWQPREGPSETIWLPHLDLDVARRLTAGSPQHDRFWAAIARPGRLTIRTVLDLGNLYRPTVQPGSTLDHKRGLEKADVVIGTDVSTSIRIGKADQTPRLLQPRPGKTLYEVSPVTYEDNTRLPAELVLETMGGDPHLWFYFVKELGDKSFSAPLTRFVLPWLEAGKPQETVRIVAPELAGGNWARGRQLFFGNEANCYKCHKLNGSGGMIGPDLSNLVHRDYASVLRDIVEPSAALNPDHLAYIITLNNGKVITGVPRSTGKEKLIIGDVDGKEIPLNREDIESMTPSPISLMPTGIDKTLGPDKMRDLLTFLLKPPLEPAPQEIKGAPPPRTKAEVEAIMKTAEKPAKATKKLRILLAAGPKDHGPGEHDYPLWQRRWYNLLSLAENISVEMTNGFPTPKLLESSDVIVFYSNNPGWTADKSEQIDAFLKRGGGLVYLHYAVDGYKDVDALAKRIGLAWRGGFSKFRHGPLELSFKDPKHPITRGFDKVKFVDESYWNLAGDPANIKLLATGPEDGKEQPLLWTNTAEKGRVFVSILGHYTWTFDDPLFRILILRAIAWSANEPADRLIDLATIGARIAD